jgi:exonuclease SbcC
LISSIQIQNFLSHKKTTLKFSYGVNIIVGATDSGKSAIIKSLKWILFNRPMGDGVRSSWRGDTSAEITIDKVAVKRLRTDTANSYFVDDQRLNAVKGDVPDSVTQALNLSDINLQTQFDSHFLLSSSSGEVAQYFNKIAHLDKIDVGLQNIQKWTKVVQTKLDYDEQTLAASEEKVKQYYYLEDVDRILIQLEAQNSNRQNLARDRASILSTLQSIEVFEDQLEESSFLQELDKLINTALGIISKQKELKNKLASLRMITNSFKKIEEEGVSDKAELEKLEKEFHKHLGKGSICPLCEQKIK